MMPLFSAEKSVGPSHGHYQLACVSPVTSRVMGDLIPKALSWTRVLDGATILPAQACQGGPSPPPGCHDSCTYSISGCDRTCCIQDSPDQIECGVTHYGGPCQAPPPPPDCTTTGCPAGASLLRLFPLAHLHDPESVPDTMQPLKTSQRYPRRPLLAQHHGYLVPQPRSI